MTGSATKITAEILALAKQGVAPREIAERLGVTRSAVYNRIKLARARGEDIPRFQATGRRNLKRRASVPPEVRDGPADLPVTLYSMRNIRRGSFALDYLMPSTDTAPAIAVKYFDAATWTLRRVSASLPDADIYQIEMAEGDDPADPDVSWTRTADTTAAHQVISLLYAARTMIRVRGVGLAAGPWVAVTLGDLIKEM